MDRKKYTIILGVTGSIAAYKACEVVSLLKKENFCVHVLMTEDSQKFVSAITFQTLSQNRVVTDMFEIPEEWNPAHISFAERADLVLIAPATANIIGKLANGICDDIITCTAYAAKAPVLIAPAMNNNMYHHDITQANVAKLKKIGYNFVGPVKGRLACGSTGVGHIASSTEIVAEVKRIIK